MSKLESTLLLFKKNISKNEQYGKNDVIFLGDSIIALGKWNLYFPDISCKNCGVSGNKTTNIIKRLSKIVKWKPQKLFLLVGINDLSRSKEKSILNNYEKIINIVQNKSPNTKIYVQSILPINKDKLEKHIRATNKAISSVNCLLKLLCENHRVIFIETNKAFTNDEGQLDGDFTVDGIHIEANGYELMSQMLMPYVYG